MRSAVYEAGPRASTEAAVFVHGNPGPLDDWEHIAPSVAGICRVVAPDLPGFGRADHPRHFDFSIGGYARHLGGLLRQLEVERAHLILHDFGGPWGLAWAAEHPERVASVTLINSVLLSADYTPVRYAAAQRTVFPRAEVHTIEGAGHWPFVDEPQRARALVCSFLQRQMESAGAVVA